MKSRNRQSGLTIVETLVSVFTLTVVFGSAFHLTTKSRKVMHSIQSTGHQVHFESFASSRLRLYFSKLLQWTSQIGFKRGESGFGNVKNEFCRGTARFAYAAADMSQGDQITQKTLAADMRMSLSTLAYRQVTHGTWKTDGLVNKFDENEFLWGAMVPFSSNSASVAKLNNINPNLAKFCAAGGQHRPADGLGAEMCRWVDWCSGVGAETNPEEDKLANVIRVLSPKDEGRFIADLYGQHSFRMCFVFVGNLFSKTGDFFSSESNSSLGENAIDNPASLGLAIATAQFVNSRTADLMRCEKSVFNMNRSMRVKLNLYSVVNADKTVASKKQNFSKVVKHFTSEKLAVDTPNCQDRMNRLNKFSKNSSGESVCITDPVFHFACSAADDCGHP